jgi:LytS/YehU family sensor histidine kinase
MTTRIAHVIDRPSDDSTHPRARAYLQAMRGMRGFLSVATLIFVAIGVVRGVVVAIVWHLPLIATLSLAAANIVIALVWLPVTILVLRISESTLPKWPRIAAFVALGVVSVVGETWASGILRWAGAPIPSFIHRLIGRSDTNVLFYVGILGAAFAARGRRRQIASELAASRVQAAVAGAQLHVLTLQLHPHFLFNALNLISQLANESVEAAQRAVANLRGLLVESLRHAVHREVPLADELSFLRAYLEIQQARFRDRLRVSITTSHDVARAAVPHLVLQPIVENAIVHGIAPRASAGSVDIAARRSNDRLILSVDDDGRGIAADVKDGVGLRNTRLRLEQLFGADHRLALSPRDPVGTHVTIDLPFREVPETGPSANDGPDAAADIDVPRARRAPNWLPVVAGWAALAMIWTEITALPAASRPVGFNYSATLIAYSINVGLWMLLTLFVVRVARRYDVGVRPTVRVLLVHAGVGIVTACAHTALWLATLYAIGSPVFREMFLTMAGWAIWDFAAYAAVVALATVVAFSARFRDSRLAIARASAQLASARVASLRLRLQPRVLLSSLDALARVIAVDAEASEATIARIGDLLRMLLTRADREFVTLGEELELLDAYLDVVRGPSVRANVRVDLPRSTDALDELVPAMLLPTLAAAFEGDAEIVRLDMHDNRLVVAVRSGTSAVDRSMLTECADRLRSLYGGSERTSIETDAAGRPIVELDLPRTNAHSPTESEIYDLASA